MKKIAVLAYTMGCTLIAVAPSVAQDTVGVEACDGFLVKYEACIAGKIPEALQAQTKQSVNQMRTMWKALATDPATKDKISEICKQTSESIKQQTTSLGCQW